MSDYTIDGISPVSSETYSSYEITGLGLNSFNFQTLNNFRLGTKSPSPKKDDDEKEEGDFPVLPLVILVLAAGAGVMFMSKKK